MRYTNPHPGQVMYPQQQQQQQVPQQQMQLPQVVMTPQGPAMVTPQGLVSIPMQQFQQIQQQSQMMQMQQPQMQQQMMPMQGMVPGMGMMVNHGGMGQGQVPQQYVPQQQSPINNQSVVQNRFGQPSPIMESTSIQSNDSGNRYGTYQSPQSQLRAQQQIPQQQVHRQNDDPVGQLLFTVTPVVHKFTGNDKFKMNVVTEAIKANQVNYIDGHLACDCLEENVECVIEQAFKEETTPMLTVRNYIVNNNFWRVDLKDTVDLLLKSTIKELYKTFKSSYSKVTDKSQINVLNTVNTMLTDTINDFLAVNSVTSISIDSFYTDFNDLLKVVRNTEEDMEEELLSYLNSYVGDMKLSLNNTAKTPNATQVTEMVSIAYLDRHTLETGMEELDKNFVQVDDSITNSFIKSVVAEIIAKINKQEFLLVTMDKSVFKFMVNTAADVYVKKIA